MADSVAELGSFPTLTALAEASRDVAGATDCQQALTTLVTALRSDLPIDRAAVFTYDRTAHALLHIAGIDAEGRRESSSRPVLVGEGISPLLQVARGELPYYLSQDASSDYPNRRFSPGARSLGVIPVVAGSQLLGTLCVSNSASRPVIPPSLLDPLFLYAGLAALPLFALFQKQERERTEECRQQILREVFLAVTNGKFHLCDEREIRREWPLPEEETIPISREDDVRRVRDAVRSAAAAIGMVRDRVEDLGLCASEAATNALLHGHGGIAAVASDGRSARVRIEDHGTGIAPDDLPRATLLRGWSSRASMGLGFTVIKETADRLYLHTGPNGTTVIIEMGAEPADEFAQFDDLVLWDEAVAV